MSEIVTFTNLSFVHCTGIKHGLVGHTCGFPINKRELLGNIAELGLDVWEDLNDEDWAAIQNSDREPRSAIRGAAASSSSAGRSDRRHHPLP